MREYFLRNLYPPYPRCAWHISHYLIIIVYFPAHPFVPHMFGRPQIPPAHGPVLPGEPEPMISSLLTWVSKLSINWQKFLPKNLTKTLLLIDSPSYSDRTRGKCHYKQMFPNPSGRGCHQFHFHQIHLKMQASDWLAPWEAIVNNNNSLVATFRGFNFGEFLGQWNCHPLLH